MKNTKKINKANELEKYDIILENVIKVKEARELFRKFLKINNGEIGIDIIDMVQEYEDIIGEGEGENIETRKQEMKRKIERAIKEYRDKENRERKNIQKVEKVEKRENTKKENTKKEKNIKDQLEKILGNKKNSERRISIAKIENESDLNTVKVKYNTKKQGENREKEEEKEQEEKEGEKEGEKELENIEEWGKICKKIMEKLRKDLEKFMESKEMKEYIGNMDNKVKYAFLDSIGKRKNKWCDYHSIMYNTKEMNSEYVIEKDFRWIHTIYEDSGYWQLYYKGKDEKLNCKGYISFHNFMTDVKTTTGINNYVTFKYEGVLDYGLETVINMIKTKEFIQTELPEITKTVKHVGNIFDKNINKDTIIEKEETRSDDKYDSCLRCYDFVFPGILSTERQMLCTLALKHIPHLKRYYLVRRCCNSNMFDSYRNKRSIAMIGIYSVVYDSLSQNQTKWSLICYSNLGGSFKTDGQLMQNIVKLGCQQYQSNYLRCLDLYTKSLSSNSVPSNLIPSDSISDTITVLSSKDQLLYYPSRSSCLFSFDSIYNDPSSKLVFKNYLIKEYNLELMEFLDSVSSLFPSDPLLKLKMKEIYNIYIDPSSPKQINISHEDFVLFSTRYHKLLSSSSLSHSDLHFLFSNSSSLVLTQLKNDIFPRFLLSSLWKDFISSLSSLEQSIYFLPL